ncbi:hypothetical protein AB1Y20_017192, partial [Prymnesium parvum]
APLNDEHAWHNATLAFMYGPLVLAAVHPPSDVWVPAGSSFKTDPSSFLRRNSTTRLEFEARAADGSALRMIPLAHVTTEPYAVYLYTAGTKPPQPEVRYCPHSASAAAEEKAEEEGEHGCEPAWPPAAPEDAAAAAARGVRWRLGLEGRLEAEQPAYERREEAQVEAGGAAWEKGQRLRLPSARDIELLALQPQA